MLHRWAEGRMYRRTVEVAVAELRRAARSSNVVEKLRALEVAEQKFKDALWLRPEASADHFETGLREIERSRGRMLVKEGLPAVERLLGAAEEGAGEREEMVSAAGELLSFLDHYLPDDERVDVLSARLRELGGERPPYRPVRPLCSIYHRGGAGSGCGTAIGVVLMVGVVVWSVVH